jgi:carbonic anhydrase/acetyltransferase-like protein (isoleucine patch superfamily)
VTIGEGSSIQDCATVVAGKGKTLAIGKDVTVGSGAFVDSSTLEEGCMVGMGARVLEGCHIGKDAFVDGGSVVPPGTRVAAGTLWTGNPASELRKLSQEEMAFLRSEAATNSEVAQMHRHQELVSSDVPAWEDQQHEAEWKEAHYVDPGAELPGVAPDVREYYKLSQPAPDTGIFRAQEWEDDEAVKARDAAELEADQAEEEYYHALNSLSRVSTAVQELASTRKERADVAQEIAVILGDQDPRGAAYLVDLAQRAAAAASDEDVAAIKDELASLDAFREFADFEVDDQFLALRRHAAALAEATLAGPSGDRKTLTPEQTAAAIADTERTLEEAQKAAGSWRT